MTTIVQGTIAGVIHGGPDNPAVNCVRCMVSGPLASGEVVQFGDFFTPGGPATGGNFQQYLPQGVEMLDAILRVSDSSSAISVQVGYAAADGANATTNGVADVNATFLLGTTAISGSGITRATGPTAVQQQQRPTNPTLTIVSGAVGSEATIELDVFYKYTGNQGANTIEDS
jgi:hypothetical protein